MKEIEGFKRRITGILLKKTPEDPEKKRILANSLLNIDNDINSCRQLLAEGSLMRRQYRQYGAFGCFTKALKDLGRLKGEEADRLLLETTVEFSQV